jgi:hypothetical protein
VAGNIGKHLSRWRFICWSSNLRLLEDTAAWWERHRRESERALDQFVIDHPNAFGVTVATAVHTSMELGAGFVDVLRIGEGARTGTAGGWARDGLRLLTVLPIGRITRLATAGRGLAAERVGIQTLIVDTLPSNGVCTSVAATQALRFTGARHLARLIDVLEAAGIELGPTESRFIRALLPALRRFGATTREIPTLSSMQALEPTVRSVSNGRGVMLLSVRWIRQGLQVGHTMVAFVNSSGAFRIADRTGTVVRNLGELTNLYGPEIAGATPWGPMAFIDNAIIAPVHDAVMRGLTSIIALEVRGALVVPQQHANQRMSEIRAGQRH